MEETSSNGSKWAKMDETSGNRRKWAVMEKTSSNGRKWAVMDETSGNGRKWAVMEETSSNEKKWEVMDEITVDKFSSTRNVTVLHWTVENQGYVFLKICIYCVVKTGKDMIFFSKN